MEAVARSEVRPAVASENGTIHRGVQAPQPGDVRVGTVAAVEQVVDLGQADLSAEHHLATVFVICLPCLLGARTCVRTCMLRKRKRQETIRGRVVDICP